MSTQLQLTNIPNIKKYCEADFQRGQIVGVRLAGASVTKSRKRSSSAGSEKMERELVIDSEKWRGIVRQAKAHSGL